MKSIKRVEERALSKEHSDGRSVGKGSNSKDFQVNWVEFSPYSRPLSSQPLQSVLIDYGAGFKFVGLLVSYNGT